jgi:AraC-like DNA-binding protein
MATVYSTSEVQPRNRAAYWREVVIKDIARHNFQSSVGPAFHGSLRMGPLGSIGVSLFECDPCETERTRADLVHCRSDDFIVSLQLAGRSVMFQDGREAVIECGNFALLDTARPCGGLHQTGIKCLIITIPRQALQARLGNVAALMARSIPAHKPIAELASGFLRLLPERLDALEARASAAIAEQAIDLIALTFSTETSQGGITLSSPRAVTLLRLKSAIEARLVDPYLKPAAAAAAAGLSVRYANALLALEGFSIERYILHRRLEHCRRALEDPAQAHRTIGEIAFQCGFSDLSHFGRRYRAAYGMAPGDYRRRTQEARLRSGEGVCPAPGRRGTPK